MNLTRRILEGIHEVELEITPEFQKPEELSYKKLTDIQDYISTEVISVDDPDKEPSDSNPVWIPGDVKKYALADDPELYGIVYKRIKNLGVQWAWNGPHRRFYMSPKFGMSVPVFWNHVHNLVSWFIELPGVGARVPKEEPQDAGEGSFEKPKVSSDDKGTIWFDFGQALILVARFHPVDKRMDIVGHGSSVNARMDGLMKMFSWVRDKYKDYHIVVRGGNAKPEDMADLVNAGLINKFVPEDYGEDRKEVVER